jgi:hypothetical protein
MDTFKLSIKGRFNSERFEKIYLKDFYEMWKEIRYGKIKTVVIDLSNAIWIDLQPAIYLLTSLNWLQKEFIKLKINFWVYLPNLFLTNRTFNNLFDVLENEATELLQERIKHTGPYPVMLESVFYQALLPWEFLHRVRDLGFGLHALAGKDCPLDISDKVDVLDRMLQHRQSIAEFIPISTVQSQDDVWEIRDNLERTLIEDNPHVPTEYLVTLSRIVFHLTQNIIEHAYPRESNKLRNVGLFGLTLKKVGGKTIKRSVLNRARKKGMSLITAENEVFKRLQIPSWLRSFYLENHNKSSIDLVIADGGIGVFESLQKTYREERADEFDQLDIIKFAFEKNSTSKKDKMHPIKDDLKGYGLYSVKKMTLEFNGIIEMRTGMNRIFFSNEYPDGHSPHEETNLPYFPGTQIRILIPAEFEQISIHF